MSLFNPLTGKVTDLTPANVSPTSVIEVWPERLNPALWDGTVTLPPDDERYRLVIAEFEEYLVDDDRPYDKVPTAKGRRMVFVEHIELS
jgi:hypothetical protein